MADTELSVGFRFVDSLDDDDLLDQYLNRFSREYEKPFSLTWAISVITAFRDLLGHCLSVSYSDENGLDELRDVPEGEWPRCDLRTGSFIITLFSSSPTLWSVNGIAIMMAVLKMGPDLAGLPQRIRERWYLDAARAERARQALEVLRPAMPEAVDNHIKELQSEANSQGDRGVPPTLVTDSSEVAPEAAKKEALEDIKRRLSNTNFGEQ